MIKNCPHCNQDKAADLFWKSKFSKDGLASYCKECQNAIRKEKRRKKVGYWAEEAIKDTIPHRERSRTQGRKRKAKILKHYGDVCCRCGFSDWRALSIDHINGDGAQHRKEVPSGKLYKWLIENNLPDGFQTLCMNCQFIKRHENREFGNQHKPAPNSEAEGRIESDTLSGHRQSKSDI